MNPGVTWGIGDLAKNTIVIPAFIAGIQLEISAYANVETWTPAFAGEAKGAG